MDPQAKKIAGRGAAGNPANRFVPIEFEREIDYDPEEDPLPKTKFFRDSTRTILAKNDSPDIGFTYSLNPYRGCEHGCIYCYARPTHEYFGLSAGLDFETKIFVKEDAPGLLREKLSSRSWKPEVVAVSGVTDCYQPAERRFRVTRRCLEVFAEFMNPVVIITKNRLVTRDIDVLKRLAAGNAVSVAVSVTTLNEEIRRVLEPRTSAPDQRLRAIRELSEAGIPVGVNMAPVIPGLTDHEMPKLLAAAAKAGARFAGYTVVRLPYGVKDLFEDWLGRHFPDHKKKVLNQVRDLRGGKLYNAEYGSRMRGEGAFAEELKDLFRISCKKAGLNREWFELSTASFRKPPGPQLELFG